MSGLGKLVLIINLGLLLFGYVLLAVNLRDGAGRFYAVLTIASVLGVGTYLSYRRERR